MGISLRPSPQQWQSTNCGLCSPASAFLSAATSLFGMGEARSDRPSHCQLPLKIATVVGLARLSLDAQWIRGKRQGNRRVRRPPEVIQNTAGNDQMLLLRNPSANVPNSNHKQWWKCHQLLNLLSGFGGLWIFPAWVWPRETSLELGFQTAQFLLQSPPPRRDPPGGFAGQVGGGPPGVLKKNPLTNHQSL